MTKNIKSLYVLIAVLIVSNLILMIFLFENQFKNTNQTETKQNSEVDETEIKPKYTRDELKNLLSGKNQNEVLEILGNPSSTSENKIFVNYSYRHRYITYDPLSNYIDRYTEVYFVGGIFDHLYFE